MINQPPVKSLSLEAQLPIYWVPVLQGNIGVM